MTLETGKVTDYVADSSEEQGPHGARGQGRGRQGLQGQPEERRRGRIREVREAFGIDRPGALAFAKKMLTENPALEAKKVIDAIGGRFRHSPGRADVLAPPSEEEGKGGPQRGDAGPLWPPGSVAAGRQQRRRPWRAWRSLRSGERPAGRPPWAAGSRFRIREPGVLPELAAFFRSLAG